MDNQIPDVVELHEDEKKFCSIDEDLILVLFQLRDYLKRESEKIGICLEEGSIDKKRVTEDTDDKLFYGAARKKRVLSRGELENPGLMLPKLKEIEMLSGIVREDMPTLPCYGDHHRKFLIPWPLKVDSQEELYRKECLHQEQRTPLPDFGECPQSHHLTALIGSSTSKQTNATGNSFSLDNNESGVVLDVVSLQQPFGCSEEMTSQLQHNSTDCNQNKHKETKPRTKVIQFEDPFNQQNKRKEKAQRVSSVVVLTMTFLGILFNVWSQLSIMKVQPLHTEHGSVSILSSLLGLLGFMVFVWGVAIMILVGAPFTRLHRAMLIFWAIMMHLRSANSIIAVYVPLPILGIFFMVWFACGKV